jgi:hypothetical protein
LLGERGRCVHHRLLVAALVVSQPILHLMERLANSGDIAMAEDAEHTGEKRLAQAITLAVLDAQKPHERLRHRQSNRGSMHLDAV